MPPTIAGRLEADARAAGGLEICGLLAGHGEEVTRRYPGGNVAADPARRFEMDPRAQIAAMRDMRERGLELVAVYHSHPDGNPNPSATDLALHSYPESLCVILAAVPSGSVEPRAHALIGEGFREVPVIVGPRVIDPVDSGVAEPGKSD